MQPFLQFWGKTEDDRFLPVWKHMTDVGCVATQVLSNSHYSAIIPDLCEDLHLDRTSVIQLGSFLAAVHDLSKCTPQFQFKLNAPFNKEILRLCPESIQYKTLSEGFNHSMQLRHYLRTILRDEFHWESPATELYQIPCCHHYWEAHSEDSDKAGVFSSGMQFWTDARLDMCRFLADLFMPNRPIPTTEAKNLDRICTYFEGVTILSDWIASDQDQYKHIGTSDDPVEYQNWSMEQARVLLSAMNILGGLPRPFPAAFEDRFPEFRENHWRLKPIQQLVVDKLDSGELAPGLVVIEAAMGDGKTEAALHLATSWMEQANRTGIYFALPTTATANQMHSRVTRYIGRHQGKDQLVRLAHGKAWLATPPPIICEDPAAQAFLRKLSMSLLHPFGVGTIDQAMKSALYIKFNVLRMLGLMGKVLVIDEIHAYDAYMETIIFQLLEWCGYMHIPVILLSATLPIKRRKELMEAYSGRPQPEPARFYPCLSHVTFGGESQYFQPKQDNFQKQIAVTHHPLAMTNYGQILDMLVEDLKDGGNAAIIVNTVSEAQNLFRYLNENSDGRLPTVRLFHARYMNRKRNSLEKRIVRLYGPKHNDRPISSILIATQVIEQSLDVDFDIMYSELCPIDLLLQRMGRLWRHSRSRRGLSSSIIRVLDWDPDADKLLSEFKYGFLIYSESILRRTRETIISNPVFSLPRDIFSLVDAVYVDPSEPDFRERIRLSGMDEMDLLRDESAWAKKLVFERARETYARQATIPSPMISRRKFWLFRKLTDGPAYNDEKEFSGGITRFETNAQSCAILERYIPPEEAERMSLRRRKAIAMQMLSFPLHWLEGSTPASGFIQAESIHNKYMTDITQLVCQKDDKRWIWQGYNKKNEPFQLIHDPMLGMMRTNMEETISY